MYTLMSINIIKAGLQGFGQYPGFTAVFTGKYRLGKNRFWTPKVGKTELFKQFHISIKGLIWPWNTLIQDMRILSSCVVWTIVSKKCWANHANVSYCLRFCQFFLIHKWCENMKLTFELLSACVPLYQHYQPEWSMSRAMRESFHNLRLVSSLSESST